jgi:hypothetical protein
MQKTPSMCRRPNYALNAALRGKPLPSTGRSAVGMNHDRLHLTGFYWHPKEKSQDHQKQIHESSYFVKTWAS